MGVIEHFVLGGAIVGFPLMFFLAKMDKYEEYAPFSFFLVGIFASFPGILSHVFGIPSEITNNFIFNVFIFYPLLNKIKLPDAELMLTFAILWPIYGYICIYYIRLIKRLSRKKESLEEKIKNAK